MDPTPLDANTVWTVSAPPAPTTGRLDEVLDADLVVVGGGYTGLSTALHATLAGHRVVVLEAREIGFGGSGRNAGHCTPTFHLLGLAAIRRLYGPQHGERVIRLQTEAADLVFSLIDRYQIACEAERAGYLRVAHTPSRVPELQHKADQYAALGLNSRVVDKQTTDRLTGSERFFGGWLLAEGGHLNPLAYARGLARAALQEGARIFTGSPVVAIEQAGQRWRVATPGGAVLAERVVIGTGAYTAPIPWPGLERATSTIDIVGVASAPLPDAVRRRILPEGNSLVDTHKDPTLYKLDRAGRLVTTVYRGRRLGRDIDHTLAYLSERTRWLFPFVDRLDWPHVWHGRLDFQPRTFPRLFELAPGVMACIGYSGRGVPTATAMGKALADYAYGADPKSLPVPVEPLRAVPPGTGLVRRMVMAVYRAQDRWRAWRAGIAEPRP